MKTYTIFSVFFHRLGRIYINNTMIFASLSSSLESDFNDTVNIDFVAAMLEQC